jgi:hypothetical protein
LYASSIRPIEKSYLASVYELLKELLLNYAPLHKSVAGHSSYLASRRAMNNGDDRDRTGNLWLAKPTLSQLSYVPVAHL